MEDDMLPQARKSLRAMQNVANTVFVAFALAAAVFLLFAVPKGMSSRATAETALLLEIAGENRTYCEKWGMKFGTSEHSVCAQDLQRIRESHTDRIVAPNAGGVWPW
jgi:hypothetical protein